MKALRPGVEQLEEVRVTGFLCTGEGGGWGDTESGSPGPECDPGQ